MPLSQGDNNKDQVSYPPVKIGTIYWQWIYSASERKVHLRQTDLIICLLNV